MKLSISNIGWTAKEDEDVYKLMKKYNFSGLEIAPTRLFPETPYDKAAEAGFWSVKLNRDYGFSVPSMQSIWYGRSEKLFGTTEERKVLMNYTKKAIEFAAAINCRNLVFGCPQNRYMPDKADPGIAVDFFRELGDYAATHGTVIGMEANPPIYNTNYMNDTMAALDLVKRVRSKGFMLNLDVGTMIQNGEKVSDLVGNVRFISHVHISEPGLKPIEKRELHGELKKVLDEEMYGGYISIEMGKVEDISIIEKGLRYVECVFCDGQD